VKVVIRLLRGEKNKRRKFMLWCREPKQNGCQGSQCSDIFHKAEQKTSARCIWSCIQSHLASFISELYSGKIYLHEAGTVLLSQGLPNMSSITAACNIALENKIRYQEPVDNCLDAIYNRLHFQTSTQPWREVGHEVLERSSTLVGRISRW